MRSSLCYQIFLTAETDLSNKWDKKQVITKCCSGSFTYVCVLQGSVQDKVKPLVFSLNVSLYEKFPKKRNVVQDLSRLPVLSQKPTPTRTQVRNLHNVRGSIMGQSCNRSLSRFYTHQSRTHIRAHHRPNQSLSQNSMSSEMSPRTFHLLRVAVWVFLGWC